MAALLSLPPCLRSSASPTASAPRSASPPPPRSNFQHPIRCTVAPERLLSPCRTSIPCNVAPERGCSPSQTAIHCNVAPEHRARGSWSATWCNVAPEPRLCGIRSPVRCGVAPEQGACTTSGSDGGRGIGEDGFGGKCGSGSSLGRREVCASVLGAVAVGVFGGGGAAMARDRRNRKEVAAEDYLTSSAGVKYYDVEQGRGAVAEKGETVSVHFDCVYRSITAVSSRESKILAGNRTIAQPYEFIVGAEPGKERKREFVDSANGLFSAQAAPKPPPALYAITEGMRVGGKRTVIVPPEIGYGKKGLNEIPPNATFEMNVELLEVKKPQNDSSSK